MGQSDSADFLIHNKNGRTYGTIGLVMEFDILPYKEKIKHKNGSSTFTVYGSMNLDFILENLVESIRKNTDDYFKVKELLDLYFDARLQNFIGVEKTLLVFRKDGTIDGLAPNINIKKEKDVKLIRSMAIGKLE